MNGQQHQQTADGAVLRSANSRTLRYDDVMNMIGHEIGHRPAARTIHDVISSISNTTHQCGSIHDTAAWDSCAHAAACAAMDYTVSQYRDVDVGCGQSFVHTRLHEQR